MKISVTTPEPTTATNRMIVSKQATYLPTWDSVPRFKFWYIFHHIKQTARLSPLLNF